MQIDDMIKLQQKKTLKTSLFQQMTNYWNHSYKCIPNKWINLSIHPSTNQNVHFYSACSTSSTGNCRVGIWQVSTAISSSTTLACQFL